MKRIVYVRPDGGVSIVTPVIHRYDPPGFTEDAALARSMERLPKDASDATVIDAREIPSDRTYRNAWVRGPDGFGTDMEKAKEIQRERIRAERAPILAALDIEYQRADEANDDIAKAKIVAEKQALRDATDDPRIEAAKTPEELKQAWPLGR